MIVSAPDSPTEGKVVAVTVPGSGARWGFLLWLLSLVTAVAIGCLAAGASAVRCAEQTEVCQTTKVQRVLARAADLWPLTHSAILELASSVTGDPWPLLVSKASIERADWSRTFPFQGDSGYLLLSGVTRSDRQSVVELIRISDGRVVQKWIPNWSEILSTSGPRSALTVSSINVARAFNPLPMPNGDVVFNNGNVLVRLGPCSSQPIWMRHELYHHSVTLDNNGNLVAPAIRRTPLATDDVPPGVQDDSIAVVGADGQLLSLQSFAGILRRNGLEALLYGTSGHSFKADASHLNSVEVASLSSRYWQSGDWLISARHISTVLLYRPSTGRVIWHRTGPWLNQHSATFVDDHKIVVYDNHVVSGVNAAGAFSERGSGNRIVEYDFDTDSTREPWQAAMSGIQLRSLTEGRVQVLRDGGLFVEETNVGRHLRFSKERLIWSRINDYDESRIGLVTWSRYLDATEGEAIAGSASARCAASGQ